MARRIVTARERVEMLSPWREAARPRRFNQDWQQVGFDLMPVDVVSRYMQRKEEGFGDEKSELYELNKQPPLSQQISERGYEKPVHLVTDGKSGSIYDGHHRIDIARQLGHSHIPVEVSWRALHPDFPEGSYDNKIDPWLKGWLTDMRKGRETVGRRMVASEFPLFLNEHGEPMGININDGKQDFTGQILRGEKSIETRDSNSLKKYIGKRIGLIRTGLGKAHVVGYATIGEPKFYDNHHDFDADYDLHQVAPGSDYHFDRAKHGVKFGYPLHDVEHEPEPYPVDSTGYVYRPIPRQAERADDFEWERSFDGPGGWELITHTPDGNPVTVETEPTRGQRSSSRTAEGQG